MDDETTDYEEAVRLTVEALQGHWIEYQRYTRPGYAQEYIKPLTTDETFEWLENNGWNRDARQRIVAEAKRRIANASNPDPQ